MELTETRPRAVGRTAGDMVTLAQEDHMESVRDPRRTETPQAVLDIDEGER